MILVKPASENELGMDKLATPRGEEVKDIVEVDEKVPSNCVVPWKTNADADVNVAGPVTGNDVLLT